MDSEALIGSLRRRAHSKTSKELTSTLVGGLGPGEVEKNKAGSVSPAIEEPKARGEFKSLKC